jgi:hypothetical protein
LLGIGIGICLTQPATAPAAQEPQAGAAKADAAAKLPTGPHPFQVLVSLTEDSKLTVKSNGMGFKVVGMGMGGGPGPGGPVQGRAQGGGIIVNNKDAVHAQTYDLKDVQIFDTQGKQIDSKNVAKLLKGETLVMATWGHGLDPLHLRLLKDGTLTFVLPAPQGFGPGMMGPGGGIRGGFGGGFPGGGPGGGGPETVPAPVFPGGGEQPPAGDPKAGKGN